MGTKLRYLLKKKIWIPLLVVCAIAGYLFVYNRPIELQKATLMSTPVMYRDGLTRPYTRLPDDIAAPNVNVFYATDRQPTDAAIINPLFYGNDRSMNLFLGQATVRFGDEDMQWNAIEEASLRKDRDLVIPLEIVKNHVIHTIDPPIGALETFFQARESGKDPFTNALEKRLSHSENKDIYIFVPGFKVDFTYPVLVAAELWHYLGYSGVFIAYSWPSRQRIRDYLSDVETAAFTAQHFRLLLLYLARIDDVERIHILSYSAGARIVSQALHEIRLMVQGLTAAEINARLKLDRVIFTAPDIDMMLFAARYRDGFEDIANTITIYTNANDTALNWALRFFGWPRLGAPGEMGLTPEELKALEGIRKTESIDVAAAEEAATGNGHGYFIKSPWVSTDILLNLKHGLNPSQRGLSRSQDGIVWEFPDTYPEKIKNLIRR